MEYGSPLGRIDSRKNNVWCKYTTRLDTYGCGCSHNCSYCYSRHLLEFRKNWDSENPRVSNMTYILKAIEEIPTNCVVKLGGMTDCFQPIELEHRNTFKTIEALNRSRINYLIVTKSDIVARDEYIELYDKELAHFQITVTSTDDSTALGYEKCTSSSMRIKALEKLTKYGFDSTLRLSPLIEDNIDFDIVNNIKCNKVLLEFLKVNHFVKKCFDIDYSKYTLRYGGNYHLELNEKIRISDKIKGFKEVNVGESVYDHWVYFRDNFNSNKTDCCNLNITNKEYYNPIEQLSFL